MFKECFFNKLNNILEGLEKEAEKPSLCDLVVNSIDCKGNPPDPVFSENKAQGSYEW